MRATFLLMTALLLFLAGSAQQFYLFVGTYTNKNTSKGIYVYRFDAATGDMKPVSTAAAENPSYLAIAPGGKYVYAVNENDGAKPGGVSAYSFNKQTGQLQLINHQLSGGDDPCYVSVDAHRKWVMVANYSGGNLSALPVHADGSLAPLTQLIQHTGTGPNTKRQEKAHVHSVIFTPDEKYLLSADLGLDKLAVYQFNPTTSSHPLTAPTDSTVHIQPGSGPRHLDFYPGKPYIYLLTEMGGIVDVYHVAGGQFHPIQQISSHPAGYTGTIGSADIHVAPGGRFLYASNRGDANNIAIFSIDAATGKLTPKGYQPTLGKTPRNFMIDPTGHWLLVANQNSDNVVLFRIDPATGLLKDTGKQLSIPAPVCLKMEPR